MTYGLHTTIMTLHHYFFSDRWTTSFVLGRFEVTQMSPMGVRGGWVERVRIVSGRVVKSGVW